MASKRDHLGSPSPHEFTPFYCAGAMLMMFSAVVFYLSISPSSVLGAPSGFLRVVAFVLAAVSLFLSVAFIVWPTFLNVRARVLYDFPGAIQEVTAKLADLEAVRREHYKARSAVESLHQAVQQEIVTFCNVLNEVRGAVIDRKGLEDELILERQEKAAALQQVEKWRDAWIDMFRLFERILCSQELDTRYREAIEKAVVDFSRMASPLGLERISPCRGEPFDDRVHQAVGEAESSDVPEGHVLECREWGYRDGPRRIAYAKVVLATPPARDTTKTLEGELESPAAASPPAALGEHREPERQSGPRPESTGELQVQVQKDNPVLEPETSATEDENATDQSPDDQNIENAQGSDRKGE